MEDQSNYGTMCNKLIEPPKAFVSLNDFYRRKLHLGKPATLYAHELKKLLE